LRNDSGVALAAIGQNESAIEDVGSKLWNNTKFVEAMIQKDGLMLRRASDQLQGDPETVIMAVRQNGDALRYAGKKTEV